MANQTPPGTSERAPSGRVRSAAKLLTKEARRILAKHGARLGAAPASAIETCAEQVERLRTSRGAQLEAQTERLDELLQQHAAFARKSAVRETLENVGIAVFVALGLRSCFYEPFKIPSSSMMPTLRIGDHIFVNKFRYGIQIPFTSTVVGQSMGSIARGEVVVFRYPLDPSEDFIKRVIGLPGDEVRFDGRELAIKREGTSSFEVLTRKPLSEPCYDDTYDHVISGCELFEETLDGRTYRVRYTAQSSVGVSTFKVPPGHYLMVGDNRDHSKDGRFWTVSVEAVDASAVLTDKDLRDLTDDTLFTLTRPSDLADPSHDQIALAAAHRSRAHDIALSMWRSPALGTQATFDAAAAALETTRDVHPGSRDIDQLTLGSPKPADGGDGARIALARVDELVVQLRCGAAVCSDDEQVLKQLDGLVSQARARPERSTRELLTATQTTAQASDLDLSAADGAIRWKSRWSGRSNVRDHYYERLIRRQDATAAGDASKEVRLRVFRKPNQSLSQLEVAARNAADSTGDAFSRKLASSTGADRAWVVPRKSSTRVIIVDETRKMLAVLDCGQDVCGGGRAATPRVIELANVVAARLPAAASDRRRMRDVLRAVDVRGGKAVKWVEAGVPQPSRNSFDSNRLEATLQGEEHRAELSLWRKPEGGLERFAVQRAERSKLPRTDAITPASWSGRSDDTWVHVFVVEDSQTVVELRCKTGLCGGSTVAQAIARRVATRARDTELFVDANAERPRPFVPRGNIKGRAERIWLPVARFWTAID